jgi:hypothetical protein
MSLIPPTEDPVTLRAERRAFEQLGLSEYARQQRRAMLLVAAVVFAFSWGGIRPSEIEAFGVKVTRWEESFLLVFSGLVLAYLIGNFASIARPEFVTWKEELEQYSIRIAVKGASSLHMLVQATNLLRDLVNDPSTADRLPQQIKDGLPKMEAWLQVVDLEKHRARYIEMYRARVRFEYVVPLIIAFATLYLTVPRVWLLAG